jgi:hypothetical protein
VLGTVATDHYKALSAKGESLAASLTGGYHLAYLVGAVCVAVGALATLLVLRPPSDPTPREDDLNSDAEADVRREAQLA